MHLPIVSYFAALFQILFPILSGTPPAAASPALTTIYSSFGAKSFGSPYSLAMSAGASSGIGCFFVGTVDQSNSGTSWTPTLTDNASGGSNTWTLVQRIHTGEGVTINMFHSILVHSLSSSTFTFTSSVDGHWQFYAGCFSNTGSYDTSAVSSQAAGTSWTTATLTAANNPEVVVAIMNTGSDNTYTVGNVFGSAASAAASQVGSGNWRSLLIEWRTVTTASGTGTATINVSSAGPEMIFGIF